MVLFRGMRPDPDDRLPLVENSAGGLGVRPAEGESGDIPVLNGMVHPSTGGMSVAVDPMSLPGFRRPKALGGTNDKFFVYSITEPNLPEGLIVRQDDPIESPDHRSVEPAEVTQFDVYLSKIRSTRPFWSVYDEHE